MSTPMYTPGPWKVVSGSLGFADGIYGPRRNGEDRNWVADTAVGDEAARKGNTLLMAAAPEMYDALKRVESAIASRDLSVIDGIRAVIARAEGRQP